jgi:hypothetical protein
MTQKSETIEHAAANPKTPIIKTPPLSKPEPTAAPVGGLSAARAAVLKFLSTELGAREVRVTKLTPVDHGSAGWTAEAEILVPNLEMKMLGLPLTQEVLSQETYALELGEDLTVISYEHAGPGGE